MTTASAAGAVLRDHGIGAKSSNSLSAASATSPSIRNKAINNAHFINITDKLSLDDTTKTEVRVQVMREYHRRRKQGNQSRVLATPTSKAPPSAQSQTQKFRLGREKILRPWVRVKPYVGKKAQKAPAKTEPLPSAKSPRCGPQESPSEADIALLNSQIALLKENSDTVQSLDSRSATELLGSREEHSEPVEQQWLSTLKSPTKTIQLYQDPASGVLDPFSAMSLLITPRTQLLLHHYFNVRLASSWLMMPMRKGLFSLAVHDAALFHTFMSHYVAAFNLRFSTGDPAESMQHRTEAIRIVNERLLDPLQALSDGTIAAVANMAVYESSNGSTKSMVVHLNGLVEMVNMRGGIQNGGFAPHVRRLIGWTDLHVASALSSKPRFPPLCIPMTEGPEATSLPFPPDSVASPPSNKHDTVRLDESFTEICSLSTTMSALKKRSVLPEENIWYSDKIYSLQHRLFSMLHTPSSSTSHPDLTSACCIAALIFCSTCLRDIGFNFRVIANLVARLKSSLVDWLEKHWVPRVDYEMGMKLFWVLGIGGIASEGKDERWWFVDKFRKMAGVLGLKDWEGARSVLEGVLWQSDLDGFGRKFWAEAHSSVW